MKTIGSNLIGFLLAGSLSLSAADLAQSKFTQVVGEVSIVDAITKQVRKAEVNGLVKAPDLVRTGPNSRAELLAGDQTLTRIGANTIFSFESRGRGVNLQQGSVLFHSPKGKGGGVIKSGGSSAAVLGTTLIVSANPQGGFKTILLEGIGRVTSAGSSSRRLDAGQVVFTLPQGGLSQTFNVDLGRLVDGSALMRGYSAPLPSLAQVSAAVAKQESLKTEGRLQDTGLIVGNKASKEGIAVIDPGTFTAALREKKSSVEKAWDRDAKVDETYLPERLLFVRSEPRYPKNSPWRDAVTDVALADELKIKSRDLVIPTIGLNEPSRTFGLIAKKLEIEENLDIHPPGGGGPQDPDLVIGGRSTHVSDAKTVTYTGQGNFTIGSESMFKATDTGFIAEGGNMTVSSLDGDVELQGVRVRAAAEATATVISHRKDVELVGGEISGREIMIKGMDKVMLNAVDFVFTGNPVSSLLAIESRTLVLHNIDLPADRPVRLKSELGLLAENPNTRAATRNGYVNYYFGVTSGGVPAELLTVGSGVGALPDAQRHITTLPISPGQ